MIGPKEKKERSLGERLNVKGTRCASPKCAAVRKPYRPGAHGHDRKRRALSEYARQIREKQKFKVSYGIDERNLRQVFEKALRRKGSTAAQIVTLLERRLDNTVFRMGLASSRSMARQLITHGHIMVNKKRVRAPGYEVKAGDVVGVRAESRSNAVFRSLAETLARYDAPHWVTVDPEKGEGKVLALPENVESPFEVNLLVESFSK